MQIQSRPWEPQDLLTDLQEIIDEEPDNYMNTRHTTLCMARDYLKAYFAEQDNPPLTLEELRELRGDAVWIEKIRAQEKEIFGEPGEYALVSLDFDAASSVRLRYSFLGYGTTWLAYRRKPEEEQHETTDNGYPEGEF